MLGAMKNAFFRTCPERSSTTSVQNGKPFTAVLVVGALDESDTSRAQVTLDGFIACFPENIKDPKSRTSNDLSACSMFDVRLLSKIRMYVFSTAKRRSKPPEVRPSP